MMQRSSICILISLLLGGCGTEVIDLRTTDTQSPASNTPLSVQFSGGQVSNALVYFDKNGDGKAGEDEYLGRTDPSGLLNIDMAPLQVSNPDGAFYVHLKAGEVSLVSGNSVDYLDNDVWLSYPINLLSNIKASATLQMASDSTSSGERSIQVNSYTTLMQTYIQSGMSVEQADNKIRTQLGGEAIDYYDDWYSQNNALILAFQKVLDYVATESNNSCCTFTILPTVFSDISMSFIGQHDGIEDSGRDPDYDNINVDKDVNGDFNVSLPAKPDTAGSITDSARPYPTDGFFSQVSLSQLSINWPASFELERNQERHFKVTNVAGTVLVAYISKKTGNPIIARGLVNGASLDLTDFEIMKAGTVTSEDNDGHTHSEDEFPNDPHHIETFRTAFNGNNPIAVLGISGPTDGGYIYTNSRWSNFYFMEPVIGDSDSVGANDIPVYYFSHSPALESISSVNGNWVLRAKTYFLDNNDPGYYGHDFTRRDALYSWDLSTNQISTGRDDFLFQDSLTVNPFRILDMPYHNEQTPEITWFNNRSGEILGLASRVPGSANEWDYLGNDNTATSHLYAYFETRFGMPHASFTGHPSGTEVFGSILSIDLHHNPTNDEPYLVKFRRYQHSTQNWLFNWIGVPSIPTGYDVLTSVHGDVQFSYCDAGKLQTTVLDNDDKVVSGDIVSMKKIQQNEACNDLRYVLGTNDRPEQVLGTSNEERNLLLLQTGTIDVYGVGTKGGKRRIGTLPSDVDIHSVFSTPYSSNASLLGTGDALYVIRQ